MPVSQGMEKLKVGVKNCFTFLLCSSVLYVRKSHNLAMVEFFNLLKIFHGLHGVQVISINLYFSIKFQYLCQLSTKSAPQTPSDRQVSILFVRGETQEVRQVVYLIV